jgi:16S rRNA (adenine1518-N6/adenine1519-N6)-dimethyltransferase
MTQNRSSTQSTIWIKSQSRLRPPSGSMPPLNPARTRQLLAELGHHPRQQLGQNFLIDGNIVRKSVALADLKPGDPVVEIGPGLGTLTEALLETGAQVSAVELDPRLAAHLHQRFADQLALLVGDAVQHPRAGLAGDWPSDGLSPRLPGFKIVANLPYAITSPWMEAVLRGPLPDRMVLMMQKEAADRLLAAPGSKHISAVAIQLQAAFYESARHPVARQCFHPVPGVDSVLVCLQRRPLPLRFAAPARDRMRQLFTQRRKQIGGLLRDDPACGPWLDRLADFGCQRTSRPEQIPLAAWNQWAEPALVLASASPRRHQLLRTLGFPFRVQVADVAEWEDHDADPGALVAHNAAAKASAVSIQSPHELVLGSDTTVALGNTVLNKPLDGDDAARMLRLLSGKTHRVHTAVSLRRANPPVCIDFTDTADVTFRPLSDADIAAYIHDFAPFDKAGAYAIQDGGDRIIARFSGSLHTVMGLPTERLHSLLSISP